MSGLIIVNCSDAPPELPKCKHHHYAWDNYMKRAEGWHLPQICTQYRLGTLIQLAYLSGADKIQLKGYEDTDENRQALRVARRSCPIVIYGEEKEIHSPAA